MSLEELEKSMVEMESTRIGNSLILTKAVNFFGGISFSLFFNLLWNITTHNITTLALGVIQNNDNKN